MTDAIERPAAPPSLARRFLPKLVVSMLLGGLFAWLVARGGVPLIPDASAFAQVAWWTIPAYVVVMSITQLLRALRWRLLIEPVKPLPIKEVVVLNWIGFFAIFALPLRLGEVARPTLCKARDGIPISAGFGTVAVERVVDGLITSMCVAWGLFALSRQPTNDYLATHLPIYGYLSLLFFASAFLALGLFLWQRRLAVRLVERIIGIVSPRLGQVLAQKVGSVADGVRSIGDARLAGRFALESVLYWGCNALGMWLLGWGCGLPMTFGHAVAIMGILAIGILLPTGPGLFGNFQLAVSAALKLYFAESLIGEQGAIYIFLLYVLQSLVIVLAGVVPLYIARIPIRRLLQPVPTEVEAG